MNNLKDKFIGSIKSSPFFRFVKPLVKIKENYILQTTIQKLKRLQEKTPLENDAVNSTELKRLIKHAYASTPYYKRLIDRLGIDINDINSFKQLPLLDKDTVRSEKLNMLSTKFNPKKLSKRFTGGSTGQPMEFYADKYAMVKDNAHHYFLNSIIGQKSKDLFIGIYGFQLPKNSIDNGFYWSEMNSDVFGKYQFSSLALNDSNALAFLNQLLGFNPAVIRGYPSTLSMLATHLLHNPSKYPLSIKGIVLTSELCTDQQRTLIENSFKTKVYFEYGNKEINIFCYSNGIDYIYRSSPIYSYVEVLNSDGTETEIGKVGKIVTTGYNNYGMPFIRYNTGDLGRVASRKGGVVTFSEIIGRSQDYLIDFNGKKKFLIASIYSHKIQVFKKIKIWQLKQHVKGEVEVLVVPIKELSEEDKIALLIPFKKFKNFQFTFNFVDDIPKTKIGKHLFVIQNVRD